MRAGAAQLVLRLVLAIGVGAGGCSVEETRSPTPIRDDDTSPGLSALPKPGDVLAYALDVRIAAADPAVELVAALDADPNPDDRRWVREKITVHLIRSTSVRVLARDAASRIWGPYVFEYNLLPFDRAGGCVLKTPGRLYYRAAENVPLEIGYAMPTALAKIEVLVDGEQAVTYTNQSEAFGTATVTLPPLVSEKAHEVRCRVTSPGLVTIDGNSLQIYVDATPPVVQWSTAGPDLPPTHFRVQATDAGGAGVSHGEFCDASQSYCLPMKPVVGGFLLATAFVPGAGATFSGRARIYDGAGNVAVLASPAVEAADLPTGAVPYLHAITLTTDSIFNLSAHLINAGAGAPAEVRALDFSPLSLTTQTLVNGWNEFLFRRPGEPAWETFGIYRAGVRVSLPASGGPWLVYAGQATTPAMQALRVGPAAVTGPAWSADWFDVPNLFFVEDRNADNAWNDDETLYLTDAGQGPWLGRGAAVLATLAAAPTQPASSALSADLACADCANGIRLVLQRRVDAFGAPVGRQSWAGLDYSSGTLPAHAFAAEASEHCLFFWDEDANGVPSRAEPRAGGPCDAGAFSLRRFDAPALAVSGAEFIVSGVPYGGVATGFVEISDSSAALILRSPIPPIDDFDGNGRRRVPLPQAALWPGKLVVWSASGRVEAPVPGGPGAGAATAAVEVRDETGQAWSAAIESITPTTVDHRLFDPAVTQWVGVAFDPQYRPRMRALRDGFLSEWTYVDLSPATLALRSTEATGLAHGFVRDTAGRAVTAAVVEWDADPFSARTHTDEAGRFSLPVLGTGRLWARRGALQSGSALSLSMAQGQVVAVQLTVPAEGAYGEAVGLPSTLGPDAVTGSSAVTLFTDELYASATLPPGQWVLLSGMNFSREFLAPGALPGISLANPAWLSLYWSPELTESSLTLRCGARVQRFSFGDMPLVDSPCWDWVATRGADYVYFLGRPDPLGGMPDAGLATLTAWLTWYGAPAAFQAVQFRDRIFNRSITATADAQGHLSVVLPFGYYAVETLGGVSFRSAAGGPGVAPLYHGAPANLSFSYP